VDGGLARAVVLVSGNDAPGLVARVTGALWRAGWSLVHGEQHLDAGVFHQRLELVPADGRTSSSADIDSALEPVATEAGLSWSVTDADAPLPIALLASRQTHCLVDVLERQRSGALAVDVAFVASNHADAGPIAEFYGAPFHHLPVSGANRAEQEAVIDRLCRESGVELVVLARFMQVLSGWFCERWPSRILNVHHSFLPAFAGARPYAQAWARGVKLIGATAHFATEELDAGPIIEQEVARVSHRDSVDDLVRRGRDLEVVVLARALAAIAARRVVVAGARTVVFTG
jgi:formyltetrahydrofolate deformylase